ncbi:MAG: hypothetical protein GY711_01715 [bacterium]|nr:hypothetical protein [bacterium]
MAKKKATKSPAPGKKRYRRSDEELIEDLKDRIKELKVRQESRRLKQSPAFKSAATAVRYIDKALEYAAEESNAKLRHALADSRKPLETFLAAEGFKLPKARLPRGRRPRE